MLYNWDHCFPGCPPIGYELRELSAERWARFHSLPESRRYPADQADHDELLTRHNVILGELARPGDRVVLVTTGYSESATPVRDYPELAELDPLAAHWRTVDCRWVLHPYDGGMDVITESPAERDRLKDLRQAWFPEGRAGL